MVIHKSLRDFRPLRYSSREGHAKREHVNRWRNIPSFCPTLQVLDISTLGDAADINPVFKFLPHTLQHLAATAFTILGRSCGKSRGIGGTYVPHLPRDLPCVAGTWLQDWIMKNNKFRSVKFFPSSQSVHSQLHK
jgi:hypothetical protein